MCFSIRGLSNLFTNESNNLKFVYHPSNSEGSWFGMIMNFDHLYNYPDRLHHLEGVVGNSIYKSLISINSQTEPKN